jgi:hypothetical protein
MAESRASLFGDEGGMRVVPGMGFASVTSAATGKDLIYVFGGASPAAPSGLNDLLR